MEKLNEKKRRWVINQFRGGRSATSIARIQKISRRYVYKLAAKYKKSKEKGISRFEQELQELGIEFWTSRRNHPQTNGKMEKWFDTLKKRLRKHPNETLQDFVKWYNEERIHHAHDYKTPEEVYLKKL